MVSHGRETDRQTGLPSLSPNPIHSAHTKLVTLNNNSDTSGAGDAAASGRGVTIDKKLIMSDEQLSE